MTHAHGAMRKNSHAIEREKSPRVSKVKSLCTREFAVCKRAPQSQLHLNFPLQCLALLGVNSPAALL